MSYKTILIGTKTFALSWRDHLKKIQQPHIILTNFHDYQSLNEIISSTKIDYILPLSDRDYGAITKYSYPIKILYPDPDTYTLLDNKALFTQFMIDNFGEFIPKVFYLDQIQLEELEFPVISKPIYSTGGQNMIIYYNDIDFQTCISKHIVQKYIKDLYEYAAYFLCIDGDIITHKVIRYKYPQYTIKNENFPADFETIHNFDLDVFNKIMNKLNYSEGACINFKIDNDEIKIFEINPRFGGSAFTNDFIYDLLCIKLFPNN